MRRLIVSNAPVCNINAPLPSAQPQVPRLPTIPVATDLPSALAAINAMRQTIQAMTNQFGFGPMGAVKTQAVLKELVSKRTTETVRVENPQDSSQFVDVKQINHLEFQDSSSGQRLVWDRPASSST